METKVISVPGVGTNYNSLDVIDSGNDNITLAVVDSGGKRVAAYLCNSRSGLIVAHAITQIAGKKK